MYTKKLREKTTEEREEHLFKQNKTEALLTSKNRAGNGDKWLSQND